VPNVYSDTLTHDAILVWLAPPDRDVIGGVQMQTAPPPAVGDDIAVGELARVQVGLALAVADDIPGDDDVTARTVLPVMAVDGAAAGEAVEGRVGVLLLAVGDDRPPAEAVTLALPLAGVSVADTPTPTEAVALRASLVVEDTLAPDDLVVVALPAAPTAVDLAAPTEAVALALNVLTLSVVDAIAVGELASRLANVVLQVADAIEIDERRFAAIVKAKKIKIRPPQSQGQGPG
jgi:hypothetical protein